MEYGLEENSLLTINNKNDVVLILVLMEYGLEGRFL